MKKITLLLAALMLFISGATFAQTSSASTAKAPATKTATTSHVKKNGTPDKRYKENKATTSTTTTHLKKNGTPDKRYKENK